MIIALTRYMCICIYIYLFFSSSFLFFFLFIQIFIRLWTYIYDTYCIIYTLHVSFPCVYIYIDRSASTYIYGYLFTQTCTTEQKESGKETTYMHRLTLAHVPRNTLLLNISLIRKGRRKKE